MTEPELKSDSTIAKDRLKVLNYTKEVFSNSPAQLFLLVDDLVEYIQRVRDGDE